MAFSMGLDNLVAVVVSPTALVRLPLPAKILTSYDDLGTEREVDMCCRAHDNCEEKIAPQEEAFGLRNDGVFPM